KFNFDNQHIVNITGGSGVTGSVSTNVLYNKAFGNVALGEVVRYGYTATAKYGSTTFFTTSSVSAKSLTASTSKWTGVSGSDIPIAWTAANVDIDVEVYVNGVKITDKWDDYLEFKANVSGNIATQTPFTTYWKGTSAYNATTATDISELIGTFKTGENISIVVQPKSGYNFSIEYKDCGFKERASGYFQKAETISASGSGTTSSPFVLGNIIEVNGGGKIMLKLMERSYDNGIVLYSEIEGKTQDVKYPAPSQNPILFSGNNVRYVAKAEKQTLPMKANGTYKFAVDNLNQIGYGLISIEIRYTDVNGTAQVQTLTNNTTFSLDSKVKQALDANKEVEIVVNFSYNPVQYEIHFYERTASGDVGDCLNNSSDVVKTTTGGASTIKVVLNGVTWTQESSNSPLGQIGKIGTTIDTKTADLWKFSFESQGIYKTVDVIMFNQTAAKYGTLTINTLSDSKNYTEFQVSDFGFEKDGIVKIYVLMEMQGFEVKIERELQVVNADQTTFSYESEDLLAVWRIQGQTIANPLIVAHGTNVQTDRANNIITIGSYIVKLNYAPNAVFYNLATEVISVVENGTTTRYSTTNVNATISRAITIKITFELNLFDINVYSYFPDNTSAQKLKTLEDLTLGKQVKLTTTEMAKAGWDVSKIYLYASSSDGNPIVWTTVKNSLVNSNWTSGDLIYNIKLQSNTSKLTSSTLTNFTFGANYFTIFVVYEARDYQIVFSSTTPDKIDMQGNVLGKVTASNVTTVYNLKYGTNLSTVITSLPTASFPNGEYKFEGWSYVRLNGQVFDYANKKFTKENFSTIDHTTKTLTLYMITSPSVVEITYSEANTSGTATYAANNKYTNVPTITKQGHTLAGWQDADGNVYINIESNTVTYAYWNKGQATTLYPIWEAKIITVTYVDKNGTTLGTGTVTYGASNYANVPAAPMVANFSFQHYKYVGAANLLVYSNNNGSAYNINDFNPTFKATYKLSGSGGFDWDLGDGWFAGSGFASAPNGIQNAATTPQYYANYASKDYPLSIKPNTIISGATYTYTWTRTQNGALDSSWTKTGQSISLRDVRDSGIYTVSIKIEFDGESITETYSIDLTVVPRTIQINQQGQTANVVAKYFDNSTLMPSSWNKISTNICDAALTLKLVFAQANVGTALAVSASLDADESSAYLVSNYVLPSVTGSIVALPVEFNVSGSQNQIGATNRQVIVPDDCITRKFGTLNQNVYCGISNLDVFLGNNVTATVSTNKNEVGIYKFDGASLILTASVAYGTFSSANLSISKTGSYEIADPGNDYINITINLNYDNTSTTINVEDIASIQVPTTAYQDIYTTKRTISIGGTRNFYQNKAFDISLFINKSNDFWTQKIGIKVDSAEETFSQSANALLASQKFALDMNQYYQTAKQIIVNIYITNIVNISYNYNLVGGETLVNASECVNGAKFVYKQTIIASGNALPQPNRIGWQFAGWRYDSVDNNGNITAVAITDNTVWSYKGNETFVLYATYTLKSPEIAVSANINKTYDANVENITFTISNYNGESITYSVKLQKVVNGVSTNDSVFAQSDAVVTKSVVNVIDSANYKLIVIATAGDETLTAESAEIIVTINPYQIFESGITLNKIYDATDALKVYDSAL
ncbi:MAG: hypothetical protein IJA69_05675, partial [Clostridia bacterium]|nr:hypothetical protein [Clostridia bacterium]